MVYKIHSIYSIAESGRISDLTYRWAKYTARRKYDASERARENETVSLQPDSQIERDSVIGG